MDELPAFHRPHECRTEDLRTPDRRVSLTSLTSLHSGCDAKATNELIIRGNPSINNATLVQDEDGSLVVDVGANRQPCRVSYESESGLLKVHNIHDNTQPRESFNMVLRGPSGKGEYQMSVAPGTEEDGMDEDGLALGSEVLFKGWEVIEESSRLWLRYKDPFRNSHWIAAREKTGAEDSVWSPWWFSPNAANMEDFLDYVSIDIQLVRVDSDSIRTY